jgi:hypothetical protein
LQLAKASDSISVTLFGIVTDFIDEHPLKLLHPIRVTPSGIIKSIIFSLFKYKSAP